MAEQPPSRAFFSRFEAVRARWNDIDIFGHLNNAVVYQLFDTTIVRLLVECGTISRDGAHAALVARSSAIFHREVVFDDEIEIAARAARIGRTSITYDLGLFTSGRDDSAVSGQVVHVFVDRTTRRPVPVPDAARALLQSMSPS